MTDTKLSRSFLLAASAAFAVGFAAQARTLSPEEALRRATAEPTAIRHASLSHPSSRLVATMKTASGTPSLYIFTQQNLRPGGFVIVSADDCVGDELLLGYSQDGVFDPQTMAPAMKWWLEQYTLQIEAASRTGATAPEQQLRAPRKAIAPLVATRWNQDAPYNDLCPEVKGVRCVTGCVATAMAQIMKYHSWPEHGKGSNTYYWNGTEISTDFLSIYFDWESMTDTYSASSTEKERLAVAQLMSACGRSVSMQYSATASGAPDYYVQSALVNNFSYDKGIRYAERDYFSKAEWEDFIYAQLEEYGPVLYSGNSSAGGHSFVCDGYADDGFFHFNWGWGGMSDGYFRLTALDPTSQGIGGSTDGYNFQQAVIANIAKLGKSRYIYDNMVLPRGFSVSQESARPGGYITLNGPFLNLSLDAIGGALTCSLTDNATGEVIYATGTPFSSLNQGYTIESTSVRLPADIPDGVYTLRPVLVNARGNYVEIPVKLPYSGRVTVRSSKGLCTFEALPAGSITSSGLQTLTPISAGQIFRLKATLINSGESEYPGQVMPVLTSGSSVVAQAGAQSVYVEAGSSMELDYVGAFSRVAEGLEPGTYTLYLVDPTTNSPIGSGVTVDYLAAPDVADLSVSDFRFIGDDMAATPSDIRFGATLSSSRGFFGIQPAVVIFPANEGSSTSLNYYYTLPQFVTPEAESSFTAGGAFPEGEPGKRYYAVLFLDQTPLIGQDELVFFTMAPDESAAIDGAETETEAKARIEGTTLVVTAPEGSLVEVFDPAGVRRAAPQRVSAGVPARFDTSSWPRGIYLVGTPAGTLKVIR